MKIIRAKMKGDKIEVAEAPAAESTKVIDLMARLQESLAQSGSARRGKRAVHAGEAAEPPRGGGGGSRSRRSKTA